MSGLSLKAYQDAGTDFLTAGPARILGDEPGLGKTAQLVVAAARIGAKRILVICPSVLLVNWEREFRMWWSLYTTAPLPNIVRTDAKYKTLSRTEPTILIANYDKFSRRDKKARRCTNPWALFAVSTKWDAIIPDEAHALGNISSNRTRSIYGDLLRQNPVGETYWWPTSGTIMPNHAGELYPHIRALFPDAIAKPDGKPLRQSEFEDRFCDVRDTAFGRVVQGSKNIKELKKIVAPYYLGRRSAEVLKELPPLRFAEHPVQLKPTNDQVSALLKQSFKTIKAALAGCQDEAEVLATLQSQEVALSTQRRIIGVLKAEVIAELVDSELIGGVDKRIIFLNHTDAIDKTASLLKHHRTVVLDGRTPMTERQGLADQFQNDPATRVFIGQTMVCREGLTLTASNQVLLGEPSWTPKDNYQAAKRASRIGQTRPVLARLIVATGTVDEIVLRVITRKTQELAEFFG